MIGRSSGPQSFSSRAAWLTAGPITVKSSRALAPMLPNMTSPTCSARPKRTAGSSTVVRMRLSGGDHAEGGHRRLGGACRRRRPLGWRGDGQHRQHAVAHEFQDLAAGAGDGAAHDAEIVVEQADDRVARQAVGGAGEAAQVAVPDHRLDGLAVAALDLARQDALAGGAPDIGVEQVHRGVAQRMRLDDAREGELQLEHAVEVDRRETARPVRHDAQRIDMAGREEQRQGDIVGRAFGLELPSGAAPAARRLEAHADGAALLEDRRQRIVAVFGALSSRRARLRRPRRRGRAARHRPCRRTPDAG